MLGLWVNSEILLKVMEESDSTELFNLIDLNRKYLRQWLPWLDMVNCSEDSRKFITSTRKQIANNQGFCGGIVYKGHIVGVIGMDYIDWQNKKTNLGFWISENYSGKGIVSTSIKSMLNYAFEQLKLVRVEAFAGVENEKSNQVLKKCGFLMEGTLKKHENLYGKFIDHNVYSVLSDQGHL